MEKVNKKPINQIPTEKENSVPAAEAAPEMLAQDRETKPSGTSMDSSENAEENCSDTICKEPGAAEETFPGQNSPENNPFGFAALDDLADSPKDDEKTREEAKEEKTDITYDIRLHFGVIGEAYRGKTLELNLVSWNNGFPKFDIRSWDHIHRHMSKGITLKAEEMICLKELLNTIELEKFVYKKEKED